MKILVTQSFGRESEYKRAILAVLSFWALYSGSKQDVQVLIFTDQPKYFAEYFAGLSVEYIPLTPKKITSMRGEIDFIHRMKIALIEEAFQRYPAADMLYVDSDTIFVKDPKNLLDNIHSDNSFMHLIELEFDEYKKFALQGVGEANHLPFIELLEKKTFLTSKGEEVFHSLTGWNAGVMGLPAKVADFLPDVYKLTDEFYTIAPLNGSEQAAFSYILQTRTNLRDCEEYVYHYWGVFKKQVIDTILPRVINKTLEKLPISQRLLEVERLTKYVPLVIKTHEEALHALNNNKFKEGFKSAIKAMRMSPVNKSFLRHLLYHTKRFLIHVYR